MEYDEEDEDDFVDDDDRPDLPQDAGRTTESGFEPDDSWLRGADWRLQHEAMRQWFLSRFQDPVHNTPFNGGEGGYLYIHGGPYAAEDELYRRFGSVIKEPDEFIKRVIDDVESGGITEWAPVQHMQPPDYDAAFGFEANTREDPLRFLTERLREVDALAGAATEASLKPLLRQLLFTSLIAALEAYLSDTMLFWLTVNERAFQRFVRGCEEFQKQKLTVSEIYDRLEGLEDEVEKYIHEMVWHRLDKVRPLMSTALGIQLPDISELMRHIVIRHDIVHRGGKTKDGAIVTITDERLAQLRICVSSFANEIENQLAKSFPASARGLT